MTLKDIVPEYIYVQNASLFICSFVTNLSLYDIDYSFPFHYLDESVATCQISTCEAVEEATAAAAFLKIFSLLKVVRKPAAIAATVMVA